MASSLSEEIFQIQEINRVIHIPFNFGTFDSQSSFCSTRHQKKNFLVKKDEQNNKDRDFDCVGLDKRISKTMNFFVSMCVTNVSEPN